jgi:hypothetical protein
MRIALEATPSTPREDLLGYTSENIPKDTVEDT